MEELEVNHVEDIHEKLTSMIGQRVKVRANMGRTRVVERMGTIKTVHPAVFIVEVDERRGRKSRQSYQYVDVLTGTVELFDPESGEHLFTAGQSARGALVMPSLSFTVSALAKVNLYLGVYATKDERGYHRVDSIMAAVGLGDTVTITPAKELSVTTSRGGISHGAKTAPGVPLSSSAVRMAVSLCSISISKSTFPSVRVSAVLPPMPRLPCAAFARHGISTSMTSAWLPLRVVSVPMCRFSSTNRLHTSVVRAT